MGLSRIGSETSRCRWNCPPILWNFSYCLAGSWIILGVLLGDHVLACQSFHTVSKPVGQESVFSETQSPVGEDLGTEVSDREPSDPLSAISSASAFHPIPAKPQPPVRRLYEQRHSEPVHSEAKAVVLAESASVRRALLGANDRQSFSASGSPTPVVLQVCLRR